ncbi:MAG: PAS domain-containing sensor histidine kinase [Bacteroidetes bacterium]|nr:PAS domain-containing sensor histidine kinase [Bacteroidota bacterium]
MIRPSPYQTTQGLRRVIALSGGLTILTGSIALGVWIYGAGNLTSMSPEYIPMAVSTGILASIFGLIFLSGAYQVSGKIYRFGTIAVVCLVSLYAFLKFIEYFLKADLTFDSFVFPIQNRLGRYAVNRISPIAGLLFFLCGLATLIRISGKGHVFGVNLVSGIGAIILFSGFTGLIGYLVETPLFYGGDITPVSLPTTFVFLVLGCGLVAMGGNESFLLRQFTGDFASARILRAILPLIVLAMLADDVLRALLSHITSINMVAASAVIALLLIPVTVWIVMKISQQIFQKAEKAEDSRRKAEASLKESEKRNSILLENLGEGIGLVDPEERFVFANPAAERIFGVPTGTLIGYNLKDFLLPDQLSKVLQETEKRTQAEPSTYEVDIITPDNQIHNLLVTATPQVNSDGAFTGTFGVFRDITARKKVDSELEKFTIALQQSNATKDKFFSIIAHDLKGPFNSILGLTNLLINDYETFEEKEIEHTLNTIRKSSEKAFELLENLLVWANSQTGQIIFNPQEFNLTNTMDENIALLEVQAARKKIRIVANCPPECIAFGDKQMIQTVLRNLMSNAIKFTHPGGEVGIALILHNNHHEISVKDTGVGIAPKEIQKLFKIESKYSTSGTSNEKGTGLGLILCKEFVEKHGGRIWVDSDVGLGSKFSFTIPRVNDNTN